jgi:ribose transport system substrate-binding protein
MMRRVTVSAVAALSLGFLAACGSSGASGGGSPSSSGINLARYNALVTKAEAALKSTKFVGPTTPVNAPRNVKLAVIDNSTTACGGCVSTSDDITRAAKLLNWSVTIFNGNADPTTQNNLLGQAVNAGYQAIILVAIDPSILKSGLAAAHKKNIPVGSATAGVPPSPTGVAYDTGADWSTAGTAVGALIVASSHGKANVLAFMDREYQSQIDLINAVVAEVKTCSTCIVQPVQQFVAADIGPNLGVRVVNLLQKNPAINYVEMGYDPAADVVVPAILQAGLGSRVSLVAANGAVQNLNWISKGQVQTGDLIFSFAWSGYAAVDQMARLLSHKPLIKEPNVSNLAYAYGEGAPWSIIGSANFKSVPKPGADGTIPFAVDALLPKYYAKLWGVSS